MESITIPYRYTGFIAPTATRQQAGRTLRQELGLSDQNKLVVASIGGGNVGAELLQATARAALLLEQDTTNIHIHLFTGVYSAPDLQENTEEKSAILLLYTASVPIFQTGSTLQIFPFPWLVTTPA